VQTIDEVGATAMRLKSGAYRQLNDPQVDANWQLRDFWFLRLHTVGYPLADASPSLRVWRWPKVWSNKSSPTPTPVRRTFRITYVPAN